MSTAIVRLIAQSRRYHRTPLWWWRYEIWMEDRPVFWSRPRWTSREAAAAAGAKALRTYMLAAHP